MKFGIFCWYGIRHPFKRRIAAIKRAGFDATSLWIDVEGRLEINPEDVPNSIRDAGLEIEYAHAPYSRINSLWARDTAAGIARELEGYVDFCARHQIPILVAHLTKGFRIKEATACGIEAISHIVEYAKERKVRLAVENTKQDAVVESVLDALCDTNLGLCFDTSHDNLYGSPKFGLLEKYGHRVFCFHISDNDGKADDHWLPGRGAIDWDAFAKKFPEGYPGALHLEILPKEKPADEEVFLRDARETLSVLERKIEGYRGSANVENGGGT